MITTKKEGITMSCSYYQFNGGIFSGDYWCNKINQRVAEAEYYKYCRDYNYDECPIYRKEESSGCFITTVCCQILGLNDQDKLLDDFRNFRDNVLQKNEKYYDTLKEYDVIGPIIANKILQDKDQKEMASGLYQNALKNIHHSIMQKDYDKAVEKYYIMTLMLIQYYHLKHSYNQIKKENYHYEDFVPTLAGHGRKRTKKLENPNSI